jgi:lipopolysaccharide/colanic/teichoic acid biosynthesis glycosyltransferase
MIGEAYRPMLSTRAKSRPNAELALELPAAVRVVDAGARHTERDTSGHDVVRVALPRTGSAAKRVFDVVAGTLLLVVAAPLMFALAAVVKATSRGPAFFRQQRVGRGGELVRITKLRTMRVDAEFLLLQDHSLSHKYRNGGYKVPPEDDYRVTRLGRFLRATSLDELPQLIDVVAGRMSLVGPRPVVPDELSCYGAYVPAYLAVRPGITGAWQVSGRSHVRFPERARIDFDYVAQWSFRRDVVILLKTLPETLCARGAF